MSTCKHALHNLADYHDGTLPGQEAQAVAEHLAGCDACTATDRDLRRTVSLLNHLPMPEPRLDLWPEFSTKMDAIEPEMRLSPALRVKMWWRRGMAHIAEGLVLYTHALADRTLARMERHLIRDPFQAID